MITNKFNTPQAKKWSTAVSAIKASRDIKSALQDLKPWRKGPYTFGEIHIDAEWDCNKKWDRISAHLPKLTDKRVLDIGCNSGFFSLKCAQLGAKEVIGIDPTALYYFQFEVVKHFYQQENMQFLPIGFEDITEQYDVILNMGILYHHPNPHEILKKSRAALHKGGTLILETLYIEGESETCLVPKDRYAKMKNVYFLPTITVLKNWLTQHKFIDTEIVSTSITSEDEQRVTPWSSEQSLSNFLDENDKNLTVEGYPRPRRVVLITKKA